jgi:hypothetical protein
VYANDLPKFGELQNEARDLLDVADHFGCKGLKPLAEAEIAPWGIAVSHIVNGLLLKQSQRRSGRSGD